MNCEKGDLAVIVRIEDEWEKPDLGRLVEILGAGDNWSEEGDSRHHWRIKAVGGGELHWVDLDGKRGCSKITHCPDDQLRPIRPQSDDAVDAHSLRIPAPARETA